LFNEEREILNEALANVGRFKERAEKIIIHKSDYIQVVNDYDILCEEYGKLLDQLCQTADMAEQAITGLLESSFTLKDQVHYDTLTGIYNRRYLEETLAYCIKTMSRFDGLLSIIMLDIDFFKKYNDTYGHSEGDACLKMVAQLIDGCITRENDFVARYGGEEFAIVLPYTDKEGVCIMADKLLKEIKTRNIPHSQNEVADYVTYSLGATTVRVRHSDDFNDYIKRADEAMYLSKNNGRNQFHFLEYGRV